MLSIATRAAWRGAGRVEPNPMVGCVIGTRRGEVRAIGHHEVFGRAHAEVNALASCRARGFDPAGLTAWVTLEPCSHTGKTPPCANALTDAGIERVVYCVADPHDEAGGGADVLRQAMVEVVRVPHRGAELLSLPYVIRETRHRAFVMAKWAQTRDGRVTTPEGHSPWISNLCSRRHVHRVRGCVDALLTGISTVREDDPLLTVREVPGRRVPARVVVDPDLEISDSTRLLRSLDEAPLVVLCESSRAEQHRAEELRSRGVRVIGMVALDGRLDLGHAMELLWQQHAIGSVMTECGPGLVRSLNEAGVVDGVLCYTSELTFERAPERDRLRSMPANVCDQARMHLERSTHRGDDRVDWYVGSRSAE
ncbi:MAG: bifunctional diaminohydroxyphosphoribosylaminopyrimidine deaminase/5-amino-6-(5-phosphoribosylamino)uracil reductase RibD [Planctomycetota bacterium]|jgi:diaminohydroxyphosphoribosylaminopyrimidine deaminase/5-amino-6-(5-phosphoribosylamino)uracil reductase